LCFRLELERELTGREPSVNVLWPELVLTDPTAPGGRISIVGCTDKRIEAATLSSLCAYARSEARFIKTKNSIVISGPVRAAHRNAWVLYMAASLTNLTAALDAKDVEHVEFGDGKVEAWPLVLKNDGGFALDFSYVDGGKRVRINNVLYSER
jgi:hypothetical protein